MQLLLITDQLCRDSVSKLVYIAPHPVFAINGVTKLCKNETLNLNATPALMYSYQWKFDQDNFSSGSNYSRLCSSDGNYNLLVIARNGFDCLDSQLRKIRVNPLPVPVITFDGQPSANGKGIDISVSDASGIPVLARNWNFSNGATGNNIKEVLVFTDSVTLFAKLTITDTNGCVGTAQSSKFFIIPNNYYLPNTFTPDGDRVNDEFKLNGYIQVKNFSMKVFNRWGEMVYETHDLLGMWDGKFKGEACEQDVYIYTVNGEYFNNELFGFRGTVTLLR
jgi:gliding motility-associated-like protein